MVVVDGLEPEVAPHSMKVMWVAKPNLSSMGLWTTGQLVPIRDCTAIVRGCESLQHYGVNGPLAGCNVHGSPSAWNIVDQPCIPCL